MTNDITHRTLIPCEIDPVEPDGERLGLAARVLREGRLVAYPTDTLYGLAADPRLPMAVARLFDIKGRSANVAIPLIAADVAQVESVATLSRFGAAAFECFLARTGVLGTGCAVEPQPSGLWRRRHRCDPRARPSGGAWPRGNIGFSGHGHECEQEWRAASIVGSGRPADDRFRCGDVARWRRCRGRCPVDDYRRAGDPIPVLLRAGQVSWDRVLQSLA